MKKVVRRKFSIDDALRESDLHRLLKPIYAARGVKSLSEIAYGLDQLLPFSTLKDIDAAADCLLAALKNQERILIIGDFDADGATSTALVMLALKAFGFSHVSYLIPNRFDFGYGLTPEIVAFAASYKPDLIFTVDNGISSCEGVLKAMESGIKVLITDHHLSPENLPSANAIINPNRSGDLFPSKNLAGVGVAFYCLLKLRERLRQIDWFKKTNIPEPNMAQYLDLVALGTVADLVSLDKNNRVLVYQGIQRIKSSNCRIGIRAILHESCRDNEHVSTADLAYVIAPRLNAAGRLDDMSIGVECLLTEDVRRAREIAKTLSDLNEARREIENGMQEQATLALSTLQMNKELPSAICLFDPSWHLGVIGLVAGRIKDRLHRPVIAFAKVDDDELKGSGRSITGLHLRDVLSDISIRHPELIGKFGGHAMAVGLTIRKTNYEVFNNVFTEEVAKHLQLADLRAEIYTDGALAAADISLTTAKLLQQSGPWGQDFPEPLFDGVFVMLQQRLVGRKHLKMLLSLSGESNAIYNAIWFHADLRRWPNPRCRKIHIVYRLDVNEYNDRSYLQLIVEQMQEI